MACYHPLKAWQVGIHEKTGKPKYKITSYETEYLYYSKIHNKYLEIKEPFIRESFYTDDYVNFHFITEYIEVPCGKCVGCRLKYSRDWANRCMLEAQYHESNYFITITYNDDNIPTGEYIDKETGEIKESHSLQKRDFQLFMKRLRKNYQYDNKIRFFASGEYGDQTARPHYHMIAFGLKLDDLKLYKKSKHGFDYYTSDFLDSCWKKGFVIVTNISWDTCAYVARYVMKKQNGQNFEIYDDFNISPEFSLMSRKPGIARQYLDDHPEIYDYDEIIYSTSSGGKKTKPPRYFDKIFQEDFPDIFDNVKNKRIEVAESLKEFKKTHSSLPYAQLLEVEERNKKAQIKSLKRSSI